MSESTKTKEEINAEIVAKAAEAKKLEAEAQKRRRKLVK